MWLTPDRKKLTTSILFFLAGLLAGRYPLTPKEKIIMKYLACRLPYIEVHNNDTQKKIWDKPFLVPDLQQHPNKNLRKKNWMCWLPATSNLNFDFLIFDNNSQHPPLKNAKNGKGIADWKMKRTYLNVPLCMELLRLHRRAQTNQFCQPVFTRDPHPLLVEPIARRILCESMDGCQIGLGLPESVVSDAAVTVFKNLGQIAQRVDLLLVIISWDFMCLSLQSVGYHLDDGGETMIGTKEMRFDESMSRFNPRSCSIVKMSDLFCPRFWVFFSNQKPRGIHVHLKISAKLSRKSQKRRL